MFYKQAQRPLREIASELGVRWIIEGSVVRSEGRVRVTAQLIDARTDEHLWARTYDRVHGDLLTIQADVAAVIARDVRGALGSSGDE
jgi:TolB-like protein